MENGYKYYFGYFFNCKDSGSILVTLSKDIGDDPDIDDAVDLAIEENAIDDEYVENIIYVERAED